MTQFPLCFSARLELPASAGIIRPAVDSFWAMPSGLDYHPKYRPENVDEMRRGEVYPASQGVQGDINGVLSELYNEVETL